MWSKFPCSEYKFWRAFAGLSLVLYFHSVLSFSCMSNRIFFLLHWIRDDYLLHILWSGIYHKTLFFLRKKYMCSYRLGSLSSYFWWRRGMSEIRKAALDFSPCSSPHPFLKNKPTHNQLTASDCFISDKYSPKLINLVFIPSTVSNQESWSLPLFSFLSDQDCTVRPLPTAYHLCPLGSPLQYKANQN